MKQYSVILWIAESVSRLIPLRIKKGLYRYPWLAGGIRKVLNRSVPPGLAEVEITAGAAAGLKMRLDLQQEKDYWLGTYEPQLQEAIRRFIQPGWTVYDVGANVGYVTLMLARKVGQAGTVLALEPLPENVKRLQDNLELNRMEHWVKVIPAAVTSTPVKVTFWVGPSDDMGKVDGSAGRDNVPYHAAIEVQGVTLDGLVYQEGYPPPQAVKMDIEGGEVLALQGMRRVLAEARPFIFLELHGKESAQFAWQVFHEYGYRLHSMEKGYPRIHGLEELDWKAYVVAFPPGFMEAEG